MQDLESLLEGEDGLTEINRVMPHLHFPWGYLLENSQVEAFADTPWALTDVWAEIQNEEIRTIRGTYKNETGASCVVIGASVEFANQALIEHVATGILYAVIKKATGSFPTPAIIAALHSDVELQVFGDWQVGVYGAGATALQVAIGEREGQSVEGVPPGKLLVISETLESETFLETLQDVCWLVGVGAESKELHVRHRRSLADLWWAAPRVPFFVPMKYVAKDYQE